jgi:hypothetical protein
MGETRKALLLAVVLAATVIPVTPARAAVQPHVSGVDPGVTEDLDELLKIYGSPPSGLAADPTANARCGDPAADPVPDGQPIVVSLGSTTFTVGKIPKTVWRKPPSADPTWRLNFYAMMWMRPLARRAAMDGQPRSLVTMVNQMAAFHRENPDPKANTYGWDEGTALRRLETENCLYALSPAAALIPGMKADAAVQLGSRYYGPPYRNVHNHGLMANLQLIRAAQLINVPAWRSTAIRRMNAEAPRAFSPAGISYEQSSKYQEINAGLWEQAANRLSVTPGAETATTAIRRLVTRARNAYAWMTEPDGSIVQIGDSAQTPGRVANLGSPVLRDNQAGWIIGRWSWTDPKTTYYTVRYGPPRWAHGHEDRTGGVTFSTYGVRVLVGPGVYNYNTNDNYHAWQITPSAQNVAIPDQGKIRNVAAAVSGATVQTPAHAWSITDKVFGVTHRRNVNVNRDAHRMIVADAFDNARTWRQSWHLDPGWTPATRSATKLTFKDPSGRKLTVTTSGRVSSVIKGRTRPPRGWHFPDFGQRLQAYEITVRNFGKRCTTTFVVS